MTECKVENVTPQTTSEIIITINKSVFKVYKNGTILRKLKSGRWKEIAYKANNAQGFNIIMINKQQYTRGRVIAITYLNLNMDDTYLRVHHLDNNRLNCHVDNLIVVDANTIAYFKSSKQGWPYSSTTKKYLCSFVINGKQISLGEFDTTEEARQTYINYKSNLQQMITR